MQKLAEKVNQLDLIVQQIETVVHNIEAIKEAKHRNDLQEAFKNLNATLVFSVRSLGCREVAVFKEIYKWVHPLLKKLDAIEEGKRDKDAEEIQAWHWDVFGEAFAAEAAKADPTATMSPAYLETIKDLCTSYQPGGPAPSLFTTVQMGLTQRGIGTLSPLGDPDGLTTIKLRPADNKLDGYIEKLQAEKTKFSAELQKAQAQLAQAKAKAQQAQQAKRVAQELQDAKSIVIYYKQTAEEMSIAFKFPKEEPALLNNWFEILEKFNVQDIYGSGKFLSCTRGGSSLFIRCGSDVFNYTPDPDSKTITFASEQQIDAFRVLGPEAAEIFKPIANNFMLYFNHPELFKTRGNICIPIPEALRKNPQSVITEIEDKYKVMVEDLPLELTETQAKRFFVKLDEPQSVPPQPSSRQTTATPISRRRGEAPQPSAPQPSTAPQSRPQPPTVASMKAKYLEQGGNKLKAQSIFESAFGFWGEKDLTTVVATLREEETRNPTGASHQTLQAFGFSSSSAGSGGSK